MSNSTCVYRWLHSMTCMPMHFHIVKLIDLFSMWSNTGIFYKPSHTTPRCPGQNVTHPILTLFTCSAGQYHEIIVCHDIYFWYRLQIAISSYHISVFLWISCNLSILCNSLMKVLFKLYPRMCWFCISWNLFSLYWISWCFRWRYIVGRKLWYCPALLTWGANCCPLTYVDMQCITPLSNWAKYLYLAGQCIGYH